MREAAARFRFQDELPRCCAAARLRLPRPVDAFIDVRGQFGRDELWMLGFDEWFVRIGVSWDGEQEALAEAIDRHVGGVDDVAAILAAHGVNLDEDGSAWVGQQDLLVARLSSELAAAARQRSIADGYDLLESAYDAAGDLEELVGPLVAGEDDEDDLWSSAVVGAWPDAYITSAVVLLRAVNITPVTRATCSALGRRRRASNCWTMAQQWSPPRPRRWSVETRSPISTPISAS